MPAFAPLKAALCGFSFSPDFTFYKISKTDFLFSPLCRPALCALAEYANVHFCCATERLSVRDFILQGKTATAKLKRRKGGMPVMASTFLAVRSKSRITRYGIRYNCLQP
jgi:hypothetical protein